MASPEFRSPRAVEEELKQYRYRRFDKLADLALDGIVTMAQAKQAFEEDDERLWTPDDVEQKDDMTLF